MYAVVKGIIKIGGGGGKEGGSKQSKPENFFGIASLSVPCTPHLLLQLAFDNIFNSHLLIINNTMQANAVIKQH